MTLNAYLILSTVLFCIGLAGVIRRKNVLMLFFSTEIMLNAVNIGFAAISKFHGDLTGQMFPSHDRGQIDANAPPVA